MPMSFENSMRLIDRVTAAILEKPSVWGRDFWRDQAAQFAECCKLHPREQWSEDHHHVLWYRLPIEEPPHLGHPNSSDWPECDCGAATAIQCHLRPKRHLHTGYYTHWQQLPPLPKSAGETQ